MNWDFATILTLLVLVSGGICLIDRFFFAPKRRASDDSGYPLLVDYARSFFPIFLIVLLLRSFLIEPFRIPSGSMMPTLLDGDFILVNKYNYGIRIPVINHKLIEIGAPKRGDVVVFRYPEDPKTPYIKRIVGVPGDKLKYRDKILYVNDQAVAQTPQSTYIGTGSGEEMTGAEVRDEALFEVKHRILISPGRLSKEFEEFSVPPGQYFVLGDNRDNSRDSRYWGTVPDANLIGRAFMIWMNIDLKNWAIDWGRIGNWIR
jgi:signal peptidase I